MAVNGRKCYLDIDYYMWFILNTKIAGRRKIRARERDPKMMGNATQRISWDRRKAIWSAHWRETRTAGGRGFHWGAVRCMGYFEVASWCRPICLPFPGERCISVLYICIFSPCVLVGKTTTRLPVLAIWFSIHQAPPTNVPMYTSTLHSSGVIQYYGFVADTVH